MRKQNLKRNDMSNLVKIFSDKPVAEKKKEQLEPRKSLGNQLSKHNPITPNNMIKSANSVTNNFIKQPIITIIPKGYSKPLSAKEIELLNLLRSRKQPEKPIIKKVENKKTKKGIRVNAITIFDKLKKAKRKRGIKITPINEIKRLRYQIK